ncbi:protein DMP8-like [Impatiens glandulifera]|uniref:protein DMP8-like n=1 Tax=Impatiens glandulifera TaxID=253017 RepID=UPI001FB0BB6F|nr:protein DMP8-like [Impatiens glandulifera]
MHLFILLILLQEINKFAAMDHTFPDEFGLKTYNTQPQAIPSSPYPSTPTAANVSARTKRAMANGVQKTLSKTSLLANFLPTGTLLTFEMVLPSIYGRGNCSKVGTSMINALLCLCSLSCFFFHFTDSFKGVDGKVYYGLVTRKGLAVFKPGLGIEVPKDEKYKAGVSDLVHAVMSVMVFMAIAFSDNRVTGCLFPGWSVEMDEIMESFPLMVGIVCSGIFLVFPNTRYGIGFMAA